MSDGHTVAIHYSGAAPCGSFRIGHDPHWIQVLRVPERGTPVTLRAVRLIDRTSVALTTDTTDGSGRETLVHHNHDAARLHDTWLHCGEGRLVHGASLLQIGPAGGMASFSITHDELGPCGPSDPRRHEARHDGQNEGGAR
jgi:hypothetical protein